MKDFQGKVPVFHLSDQRNGCVLAAKGVQERIKVVLADVEEPALKQAEAALSASGTQVLAL